MSTTPAPISPLDALRAATALRAYAEKERAEAVGQIHNAKLSRLDEATRCDALAEKMTEWAHAEQQRAYDRVNAGIGRVMRARRAARSDKG